MARAGKAVGTRIKHVLRQGETMSGVRVLEDGRTVFEPRAYRLHDRGQAAPPRGRLDLGV